MSDLTRLIPLLAHHVIMVVGDVILDEYVIGTAQRMSREAPIPVLELLEKRFIPGGASNPSVNIMALGSEAWQVGVVGKDSTAEELLRVLKTHGIRTEGLLGCDDRPTTLKTRIMAQMGLHFPQQVARIDTLSRHPITPVTEAQILEHIAQNLPKVGALLLSDYHGGLLTPSLVRAIQIKAQGKLLSADAQGNLDKYRGFDVVKCNADDAQRYLEQTLTTHQDFAHAANALCQALDLRGAMVITRGAEGATLATSDGESVHCPSPNISNVYDTVGAGDTAIAVITLARLGGASWQEVVILANYASGIVVQYVGNHAPTPQELHQAIQDAP